LFDRGIAWFYLNQLPRRRLRRPHGGARTVADLVADGPKTAETLARETGLPADGLRRLLRALTAFGMPIFGKIFIADAFIRSCTLVDISEGGACLRVDHASDLPEVFHLVLDGLARRKNCRVVWRKLDNIGVTFNVDEQAGAAQNATA
jgi:hypothetical protein